MSDSKNDIAWNKLFEKHKILEKINANDSYQIKASEIKEFREARLMTKFDYKSQLPKIFANNNLSRPLKNTHQISGKSQFFCFCIK